MAVAMYAVEDIERQEQVTMRTNRQWDILRKKKEASKADRERRGIGLDVKETAATKKKVEAETLAEEKDIARRVANKYEQTLLGRPELDAMYKQLIDCPATTDPIFHQRLIERLETRCRLAPTPEEATELRARMISECELMLSKHPTSTYALELLLSATLQVEQVQEDPHVARLLELQPDSWVGRAAQGVWLAMGPHAHSQAAANLTSARIALSKLSSFTQGQSPSPPCSGYIPLCLGWCVLARAHVEIGEFVSARDCVRQVHSTCAWVKVWYPHDPRVEQARRDSELSLAASYAGDGTDARHTDMGVDIYTKISSMPEQPVSVRVCALRGLARCFLLRIPRDIGAADEHCR
jgi:hypothetical protein